jgi:hypothetical protein
VKNHGEPCNAGGAAVYLTSISLSCDYNEIICRYCQCIAMPWLGGIDPRHRRKIIAAAGVVLNNDGRGW